MMTPLEKARYELKVLLDARDAAAKVRPRADPALARLSPTALKQHRRIVDREMEQLRVEEERIRAAQERVRIEEGHERRRQEKARVPFTRDQILGAKLIRTRSGWWEVVKVHKATVKVKVDPGWDDLIPISKILEHRR